MATITATSARQNLYDVLSNTIEFNQATTITTKHGNAVLISEEDYTGYLETVYLMSCPKTHKEIIEGINTPLEDCIDGALVNWDEL